MWAYADFRLPGVERLAKLAAADAIKINPGEPGPVETTFAEAGVPARTLEIGAPRQWRQALIQRSVEYIERVLADMAILPAVENGSVVEETGFIGTTFGGPSAAAGGFVETLAEVLEDVVVGQEIARIYNVYGDVVETVRAGATARMLSLVTDPAVEQGRGIATLIHNATSDGNSSSSAAAAARAAGRGSLFDRRASWMYT